MIKRNKGKLLISSLLILLPALFGFLMWDSLPETLVTHWGVNGMPDGRSGRLAAVLFLPLILLVIHWVCMLVTAWDNKKHEQNNKLFGLVFWIIPVISLLTNGVMYAISFKIDLNLSAIMIAFFGCLFVIIGNYLPKCKQNHTLGIKLTWTLINEENWNKTHRIGGIVWVIGGILLFPAALLPTTLAFIVMIPVIAIAVIIPTVYSYCLYRRQLKDGTVTKEDKALSPYSKRTRLISLVLLILILVLCVILCFTGDLSVEYTESSFTVKASFYTDLTVEYASVDRVEFRDSGVTGTRVNGFGSPRLLLGWFDNEEFGYHMRYSYNNGDACVVLHSGDEVLVIGLADPKQTKALYETLLPHMT